MNAPSHADKVIVVIGGGVAEAGHALFRALEERLRRCEWQPAGRRVPLVRAQLSPRADAFGAAWRALHAGNPDHL